MVERRLYPATIRAILADPSILKEPARDEGAAVRLRQDRRRRARPRLREPRLGPRLQRRHGQGASPEAGLAVTDVAELTGFPAILGHRVVTLHPKVHGGILADRRDPDHQADMAEHGIEPFDLVVVNLYPFGVDPGRLRARRQRGPRSVIDIGGPAMIRAAAKNHAHVGIVTDPADYDDGARRAAGRRARCPTPPSAALARKAFAHTAAYDAAHRRRGSTTATSEPLPADPPPRPRAGARSCATARTPTRPAPATARSAPTSWWDDVEQHGGMALSYLNLFDADAAWLLAHDLAAATGQPAVAIIKHANPCGAAVADTLAEAYQRAFECDERSAFGGIVALSDPVDEATVERMVAAAQADVVIAPGYGDGVDRGAAPRSARTPGCSTAPPPDARRAPHPPDHRRPARAGRPPLRRDRAPTGGSSPSGSRPRPSGPTPSWPGGSCGWVKSNSIVLVKDGVAWGIGAGQQNRVEAGEIAATKAAGRAAGGACASDAFYPFPDGIEAAADAGVAVVIQPGGSVKDDDNIAKADELGVAMVFTGERHFLH